MKIGSSQLRSSADVQNNVELHVAVVRRAAARGCRFVLFPELSLTAMSLGPGREPRGLRRLFVRGPFGKLVNILAHEQGVDGA